MSDSARTQPPATRAPQPLAICRAELADESATAALAGALAPLLETGFVMFLSGELGSGKTSFARALLRALGHTGRVRSPTFTLVEPYNLSSFALYHFDFYRFTTDDEWRESGFDEFIGGPCVALIEWPERGAAGLPAPDLHLRLAYRDAGPQGRTVQGEAYSQRGLACLNAACAAGCCKSA